VLSDGGVTEEYHKLLDRVAKKVGVPTSEVRQLVTQDFPHAARLLDGLPFSASVADALRLVDYLANATHTTPAQTWDMLRTHFPKIYQIITNLHTVTDGWTEVPGTEGTRQICSPD
jgi:hypothetical protein